MSNTSKLYTPSVYSIHLSIDMPRLADRMLFQEGSRIYTPVRLGFPRQTLDGASYNGQKIPKDMVRTVMVIVFIIVVRITNTFTARHHEPDGRQS